MTIELQETARHLRRDNNHDARKELGDNLPQFSSKRNSQEEEAGNTTDDVPPPNAHISLQRWNHPKGNIWRLAFAFLSFIIAGMNDAAIGVCHSIVCQ